MLVYLIGSLRNSLIPIAANHMRDAGLEVFDDWFGAGDEADDKWQAYEKIRGRNYRDALAGHAAQHVFRFDEKFIKAADAVMLMLPAGKSGHMEFGVARGMGKPGVILLDGEPERFDVMYNFASLVTSDIAEATEFFTNMQQRQQQRPKCCGEPGRGDKPECNGCWRVRDELPPFTFHHEK